MSHNRKDSIALSLHRKSCRKLHVQTQWMWIIYCWAAGKQEIGQWNYKEKWLNMNKQEVTSKY